MCAIPGVDCVGGGRDERWKGKGRQLLKMGERGKEEKEKEEGKKKKRGWMRRRDEAAATQEVETTAGASCPRTEGTVSFTLPRRLGQWLRS